MYSMSRNLICHLLLNFPYSHVKSYVKHRNLNNKQDDCFLRIIQSVLGKTGVSIEVHEEDS
jgi:hypothetical protein